LKQNRSVLIGALAAAAVLLGCICIVLAVAGGVYYLRRSPSAQVPTPGPAVQVETSIPIKTSTPSGDTLQPTLDQLGTLPSIPSPIPTLAGTLPGLPALTPGTGDTRAASLADETLKTLQITLVHINDPILLAEELQGKHNIPTAVPAPAAFPKVGDTQQFWVSNEETNKFFQVTATLRYSGQHLYFWIENGVSYSYNDVKTLVDTFDAKIYPTDRSFFGDEWTPGVDNDPHLYALYAAGMGNVVAGYFSTQDEYPPEVYKYSNAHEMFVLNADTVTPSEPYVYSTMAHEFQHMIHWNTDRNEDLWLNEGFSVLAQHINGYTVGGFDASYALNPDLQLSDWSLDHGANGPHYGAAFLYLDYLLGRFGSKVTQSVVNSPLHGLISIEAVLSSLGVKDPQTGRVVTADDVFADWAVANFLQDARVGDGRFAYPDYPRAPHTHATQTQGTCPFAPQQNQVHQYGVDYINITCRGNITLTFTGSTTVPLVPAHAYSGSYDFWSNKGDESDMTLTHSFDFTSVSGPIEFSYHTWYDLEDGYDFVYLEASQDGKSWQILQTPSCSNANPSGSSYGCGYTGASSSWIDQTVDLSAYAGKKIELRFEYLTDAGLNGEGFLVDDISLPQVGYATDFEKDDGGWQADGFARVHDLLPQTFRVSLILQGRTTTVQYITLDASQSASIPLTLGGDVKNAVLVISGTTRFTRQEASYQVSVAP
jgi:immune inhibitor A